jgi:triosephosphate isomerase
MTPRRPLVAGNWKMNGSRADAAELVDETARALSPASSVEVLMCPPYVLIPLVAERLARHEAIAWGGQDLDVHDSGAYTGAVSGSMLRDFGCTYVIVGHSERRALFGETDEIVAAKFAAAQSAELIPILCVGETLAEREDDRTEEVVQRQLQAVLKLKGAEHFQRAVIAYEPVWAIGTGRTATPDQAQAVHEYIRTLFAGLDRTVAGRLRILYGGSIKGSNAGPLFRQKDIDGGLIGGASLKAGEFLDICRAAENKQGG